MLRQGIPENPLITVREARKLLGKDSSSLSDDQVQEIIIALSLMAHKYLNGASSKKELGI